MRGWSRAAPVMPVGPPITSPAARAIPPRRGRVPAAWRGARGRRTRRRAPRAARSPRAPAHGAAPPPATASARAAPNRLGERGAEDGVLAEPLLDLGADAPRPARRVHLDREPRAIDRDRAEHRVLPALVLPVTPLEPREANGAELSRGVALGVGQKLLVAHVERQRLEPLEGLTRRAAEVEAERRRDERIAVGVAELRRAGVNVVPDGEVRLAHLDVPLVAPPVRAAPPLAASGGGAARAPRPGLGSSACTCGRSHRDRGRSGRSSHPPPCALLLGPRPLTPGRGLCSGARAGR